jgi:hypothetical protein
VSSPKVALGFALCVALLAGCTQRITDFTIISTKNVNVAHVSKGDKRVIGQDCVPVFFLPLGTPNLKEAIDKAIEDAGAQYDALIDGVVYYKNKSFIFGTICYEVEGTPIGTKGAGASIEPELQGKSILYHSRLGLTNDLTRIPFVELADNTQPPSR